MNMQLLQEAMARAHRLQEDREIQAEHEAWLAKNEAERQKVREADQLAALREYVRSEPHRQKADADFQKILIWLALFFGAIIGSCLCL